MIAHTAHIESEEDGFYLVLETTEEDSRFRFWISEPADFYRSVQEHMGEWYAEREFAREDIERGRAARARFECGPEDIDESGGLAEVYKLSDPKHPRYAAYHRGYDAGTDWRYMTEQEDRDAYGPVENLT